MDTQVKEGDLISRVLARLGDGPAKPPGPDPESEEAEVSHRPMGASIGMLSGRVCGASVL